MGLPVIGYNILPRKMVICWGHAKSCGFDVKKFKIFSKKIPRLHTDVSGWTFRVNTAVGKCI